MPQAFGLSKDFVDIGAGAEHSFAIHKSGQVYSWGLNNFGQTGINERDGDDFANVLHPTLVETLDGHGKITCITGGNHHSVAVTDMGACLAWGRIDTYATGLDIKALPPEDLIRDERGNARILKRPTPLPGLDAAFAAAGSDHSLAVTRDGKAYSWGFSVNRQTGQGTDDDVEHATLIDNTAVRGKKLVWAGAGGQYSVLAGEVESTLPNGVH